MKNGDVLSMAFTITLNDKGDERGSLVAIEELNDIPFSIKRIYYIFDTAHGMVRGKHAHQNLEQIAICVKGSCTFDIQTKSGRQSYLLNSPKEGLYMGGLVWREMRDFSEDCVLLVLASELYTEDDYIRDYNVFINRLSDNNRQPQTK